MDQLALFTDRLPARPYCADGFPGPVYIRPAMDAIKRRYIQPNGPTRKLWLVVDVDRPGAAYDWQLEEHEVLVDRPGGAFWQLENHKAPAPNLSVENPENRRAHLLYGLELPVHTNPEAQVKPLRYAASIEHALVRQLGGDFGYAGLLCKNPLHPSWTVRTWQQYLYTLDWLADGLDLAPYHDQRRRLPAYGLGRNCTLFENLRLWAYRAIRAKGWPDLATWSADVLLEAGQLNNFPCPLPFAEVRATARSVARWTWRTMSEAGFRAWQARVGRLGGLASGKTRIYRRDTKLQQILPFPELASGTLAKLTGIPARTVRRLRNLPEPGHEPISDTSSSGAGVTPPPAPPSGGDAG